MTDVERQLREQLDEANETIRQLRDLIEPEEAASLRAVFELSPQQGSMLALLMGRDVVSKEAMAAAAPAVQAAPSERNEAAVFGTQLARIRIKIAPVGGVINAIRGFGYSIPPEAKRAIRQHVSEYFCHPA